MPLDCTRSTVTFSAAGHHCPLASTKLYCLVTEAHVCEQLVQSHYTEVEQTAENATYDVATNFMNSNKYKIYIWISKYLCKYIFLYICNIKNMHYNIKILCKTILDFQMLIIVFHHLKWQFSVAVVLPLTHRPRTRRAFIRVHTSPKTKKFKFITLHSYIS